MKSGGENVLFLLRINRNVVVAKRDGDKVKVRRVLNSATKPAKPLDQSAVMKLLRRE